MASKEAARRSGNCARARVSTAADTRIVQENWELGTLWAGLAVGVSFGLMLLWAAVMW